MKWFEFECKKCRGIFNKKKQGFLNWDYQGNRTNINYCNLCNVGSSCIKCKTHNKGTFCSKCYIDNKYGEALNVIYLFYKKDENVFKIGRTNRLKRRHETLGVNYILLDTYALYGDGVERFDGESVLLENKLRKSLWRHRVYNDKDKRLDYFKSSVILEFDSIGFKQMVKNLHLKEVVK